MTSKISVKPSKNKMVRP